MKRYTLLLLISLMALSLYSVAGVYRHALKPGAKGSVKVVKVSAKASVKAVKFGKKVIY